jgi:hypothetical protein
MRAMCLIPLLCAVFSATAPAQRTFISVPGNTINIRVGDTLKGITVTAYDTRNRRVPSAKFSWKTNSPTILRLLPSGNGASLSIVALQPSGGAFIPVTATWLRSGGYVANSVAFTTTPKVPTVVPVATVDDSSCWMKPSEARAAGFDGSKSYAPGVNPATPVTCYHSAGEAAEWPVGSAGAARLLAVRNAGTDTTKLPPRTMAQRAAMAAREDSLDRLIPQSQLGACMKELTGKYKAKLRTPSLVGITTAPDGKPITRSPQEVEIMLLDRNLTNCQQQLAAARKGTHSQVIIPVKKEP